MPKVKRKRTRCKGSLEPDWLSWPPNEAINYPGAIVCGWCSGGILVKKRSVGTSYEPETFEWQYGIARVHYIYEEVN